MSYAYYWPFDYSNLPYSTVAEYDFAALFDPGGSFQNDAAYNGSGTIPPVGSTLTNSLIVTGGPQTNVPNGYQAVYDINGNDNLNMEGDSIGAYVFMSGSTNLALGSGTSVVYAAGADTITATGGTQTVFTGGSPVSITDEVAALTVYVGTGDATVVGGAGPTTVAASPTAGQRFTVVPVRQRFMKAPAAAPPRCKEGQAQPRFMQTTIWAIRPWLPAPA